MFPPGTIFWNLSYCRKDLATVSCGILSGPCVLYFLRNALIYHTDDKLKFIYCKIRSSTHKTFEVLTGGTFPAFLPYTFRWFDSRQPPHHYFSFPELKRGSRKNTDMMPEHAQFMTDRATAAEFLERFLIFWIRSRVEKRCKSLMYMSIIPNIRSIFVSLLDCSSVNTIG